MGGIIGMSYNHPSDWIEVLICAERKEKYNLLSLFGSSLLSRIICLLSPRPTPSYLDTTQFNCLLPTLTWNCWPSINKSQHNTQSMIKKNWIRIDSDACKTWSWKLKTLSPQSPHEFRRQSQRRHGKRRILSPLMGFSSRLQHPWVPGTVAKASQRIPLAWRGWATHQCGTKHDISPYTPL